MEGPNHPPNRCRNVGNVSDTPALSRSKFLHVVVCNVMKYLSIYTYAREGAHRGVGSFRHSDTSVGVVSTVVVWSTATRDDGGIRHE